MKANINGVEVEGTPDEMKEFLGRRKTEPLPNMRRTDPTIKRKYKKRKGKKGWSKGRKLTAEHKRKIAAGVRKSKIKTVRGRTDTYSLAEKSKIFRLADQGLSYKEIAKAVGRSESAVYQQLYHRNKNNNHQRWTAKEDYKLKDLIRSGYSYRETAKKLGRTLSSVKQRVKILRRTSTKKI